MYEKTKIDPEKFVDETAWSSMEISFNETAETDKAKALAVLYSRLSSEQKMEFREIIGSLDNDTNLFVRLIKKHETDTEFDCQADKEGFDEEDYEYFAPFYNAFRHLCYERGEEWAKSHDWLFDPYSDNEYEVCIIKV